MGEHHYATLQDFLDFLDDLSCDDYPRIAAISQLCPARLVSTIHKVKGLEDTESVFKEINLSYAARPGTDQQDHIRQRVKIDDVIELRSNGNFYHEGKSIGCLSKKMRENIGGLSGPLQVRSVYAYPQKEDSSAWLAEPYRQRGWSYVVIPKGVL